MCRTSLDKISTMVISTVLISTTAWSSPAMSDRLLIQRLLPAVVAGLVVSFSFVALFTSALHTPRPNALDVGVMGPPAVAGQVQLKLGQAVRGGFDVHTYADEASARSALRDQ